MTITELRAETVLMVSRDWPIPVCPRSGSGHDFTMYVPGIVCDDCGAAVTLKDVRPILNWWRYIEQRNAESWPNN